LIFIGICELALGKKKTTQEKLSSNLPGNQSFRVEGLPFQIAPETPQEEISRTDELSFPARFPPSANSRKSRVYTWLAWTQVRK